MDSKISYYRTIIKDIPKTLHDKNGAIFTIDIAEEWNLREIYEIVEEGKNMGNACYGIEDFQSFETFQDFSLQDNVITMALKTADGETQGTGIITDSEFSRSHTTVLFGTHIALRQTVQNRGLENLMMQFLMSTGKILGYEGFIGEKFSEEMTCSINEMVGADKTRVIGTFPKSRYIRGKGWTDTTVLYVDLTDGTQDPTIQRKTKMLPFQPKVDSIYLNTSIKKLQNMPKEEMMGDLLVTLDYAKPSEFVTVYEMFKAAADNGEGYDIDEFKTYKHFVHKFKNAHLFLVKDQNGRILIVFTIIPSRFCTGPNPVFAAGPVVFSNLIRGKGYGKKTIVRHYVICMELGYEGTLAEAFVTNIRSMKTNLRGEFSKSVQVVGEIPKIAFVKGEGYVSGAVFYRPNTLKSNI